MNKKDIEASKNFLQSEISSSASSRSRQPAASTSASSTIQDLIKCFCGTCESWFKRKSIEYALKSNGKDLLADENSRKILIKYLEFRQSKSHFKSPAQEIVNCYELCEEILKGEKDIEEFRYDLSDMCYTEYWENLLSESIDNGTVSDFLNDLMRESAIRLEATNEYRLFKDELMKKLAK